MRRDEIERDGCPSCGGEKGRGKPRGVCVKGVKEEKIGRKKDWEQTRALGINIYLLTPTRLALEISNPQSTSQV